MVWIPESMMVNLSEIENSRVGAGLQKDGEFGLGHYKLGKVRCYAVASVHISFQVCIQ